MRTSIVTLNGAVYTLCLSAGVYMAIEGRGDTISGITQKIDEGNVTARMTLLGDLLQAGYAYEKACGKEPPTPPVVPQLATVVGPDDFAEIDAAIIAALSGGQKPTVEVNPPKKGKGATQAG